VVRAQQRSSGRARAALAAALAASSLVAVGPPTAAGAALPQGAPVGAPGIKAISVGLTDDAVYAATSGGVVTHARDDASATWSPVVVDDATLSGSLLAAEDDVLLVAGDDDETLTWRSAGGTWSSRRVPTGTTLARGGRYAVLPPAPDTEAPGYSRFPVQDARTGEVVWDFQAVTGTTVSVDGDTLTAIARPSTIVTRTVSTRGIVSERTTSSATRAFAPVGRWAVQMSSGYPYHWVVDVDSVYTSWASSYDMDDDSFVLGHDVVAGLNTSSHSFAVAELAGDRAPRSYGPAAAIRPDVDDSGTTAAYVDTVGRVRLVDVSSAPRPVAAIVDHAAPDDPSVWVADAVTTTSTVVGHAYEPADRATEPFRSIGGVVTEMRARQTRAGAATVGAWGSPRATTALSVPAVEGATTCFQARAHDAAGNTTPWSGVYCTMSDLSAPRLTSVTVPSAVAVTNGRGTATVRYSASDSIGVAGYDVRTAVRPRGASTYGAWKYPAALQGTSSTSASASITTGQRICFAVRARDLVGHVSAWSASHCLGTDVAAPRMTRVSVPTWRGVPSSSSVRSTVTYAATDDRGVASYDVRARVATPTGALGSWKTLASRTTKRSVSHTLRAGWQACYEVRARDAIGRVSAWSKPRCTYVAAPVTAPTFDADRLTTVGGHRVATVRSGDPYGVHYASANVFAQTTTGVRLQVRTCPTCGTFQVQVGKKVMNVKTRSATTGWKYVTLRWKPYAGYVDLDAHRSSTNARSTSSFVRSWTLIRQP